MNQYLTQGEKILNTGNVRTDRTGTGTRSLFGKTSMTFDLQEGLPLETSKFVSFRLIGEELLWFLNGSTNNKLLLAKNVHIWDEWALEDRIPVTVDQRRSQLVGELALWGALHDPEFAPQAIPVFETHEALDQWLNDFRSEKGNVSITPEDFPTSMRGPLDGELGPVYGKMWRSWPGRLMEYGRDGELQALNADGSGDYNPRYQEPVLRHEAIDQIEELIKGLKKSPYSRRHVVSGWNPALLPDESASHETNVRNGKQVLPPCHLLFQFYVRDMTFLQRVRWMKDNMPEEYDRIHRTVIDLLSQDKLSIEDDQILKRQRELLDQVPGAPKHFLDCQLYQRSADWCLGVPFNIASYALLTCMVAHCVDMLPGEFIHTFGDAHIYSNHIETFKEQLQRESHPFPTLKITAKHKDIFGFSMEEFVLEGYKHSGKLEYKVAV